ncbi:MAG: iron-sulfur cluster assembly scaffold protein, partial [Pseudobdellovibrionaceae bacterium]
MNLDEAKRNLIHHSKSEKNGFFPENATHQNQITNPICGDHVQLKFRVENQVIREVGFSARACAICTASASILCENILDKKIDFVLKLAYLFEESILASSDSLWAEELNGFISFQHLRVNPSRRACALLPWIALRSTF